MQDHVPNHRIQSPRFLMVDDEDRKERDLLYISSLLGYSLYVKIGGSITMAKPRIELPREQLAEFCRRWGIRELALFGSVLRDDFRPNSDLEVLVIFASGTDQSLLVHVRMEQELAELLGRKIDVLSKRAVEQSHNLIRRQQILDTAQVVYVS
jgi:predicted nucleotidyltransferase